MKKQNDWHLGDFMLCILAGAGLSINVFAGYEMNDPWSGNLLITAAAVLFSTVVLFAAHFSRYGMKTSVPVTAALIGASAVLYNSGTFFGAGPVDKNPYLFWIIVTAVSIIVFWTARSRAGIVVLFLVGTFLTASFDFLKYPVSLQGYSVFVFGAFALLLYRTANQYKTHPGSSRAMSLSFAVQSVVIALIAFLLASGIYYSVVRPISPPSHEAEMAQKLMSMKILEDWGISSKKVIIADKPETQREAAKQYDQQQNNIEQKNSKSKDRNQGGELGNGSSLMAVMAVTYERNVNKIWIAAAALLLAFSAAVAFRLCLRKRWYGLLLKKANEDGAMELYLYFLKKLKKAGFKKPDGLTLLEYAFDFQERLDRFSVYDVSFLRLTQIYLKMVYGYQKISYDEYELFHDFYTEFHKNLRNEMGSFRYYLKFFAI